MMDTPKPRKPSAGWCPIRDLPPEAGWLGRSYYRSIVEQWRAMRKRHAAVEAG